jgi:hypothetical protein
MTRLLLASLASVVFAPAVQAANLFSDPGFDSSLGDWSADAGTAINRTTGDDFGGNIASGSMEMRTSNGSNGNLVARACLLATPGNYDFATGVKLVSGDSAGMQCDAYASTDCSGASLGSATAEGAPSSNWSTLSASSFNVPAGSQSVGCVLTGNQPLRLREPSVPAGFSVAVRFDDVVFQLSGTPVTLQGFDVQ